MSKANFFQLLQKEIRRVDSWKVTKRKEKIIEGFTRSASPKAIIDGEKFHVFNSNDYLGLRHHPLLKKAESMESRKYGTGPGAVRFISGTLKIHRDLEKKIARFHDRDDAIVFSSAFAANLAVIFCLLKGQSKDSLVVDSPVVISDALNHRSIIDGIRLANLPKENRLIYPHLDYNELEKILKDNRIKFTRAVVITDGIFSMLGEYPKLKIMQKIVKDYDRKYEMGVLLFVDDSHGVGAIGVKGRGVEEAENTKADILTGTFGKAFGADGGYVVADQIIIDYLRESAATYIYSNSITPGTAGAAYQALILIDKAEGKKLLKNLRENIDYFQKKAQKSGLKFAADSHHPIQPLLIGDPAKTKEIVDYLFKKHILVTNISFPVVPKGRDEIRIQLSSVHTKTEIDYLVENLVHVFF